MSELRPALLKGGIMLHRLRWYLSRMFEPYLYTPEGFRLANRRYSVPMDSVLLPTTRKRVVSICNLFSNEHKSIDEITKLLDTNRRTVIQGLIQEGLIFDRRQSTRSGRKLERRQVVRYHLPLVLQTGQVDQLRALCGQFGAETVTEFVFREVLKREEQCEQCRKRSESH